MKQFDLQEYLKNPERKVVTREGKSVRIICVNRLDNRYPVVAFIRLGDDYEDIWAFTKDGEAGEHGANDYDLFFASIKREGWINIYYYKGEKEANTSGGIYSTKEEALAGKSDAGYVDTIKIQWEA